MNWRAMVIVVLLSNPNGVAQEMSRQMANKLLDASRKVDAEARTTQEYRAALEAVEANIMKGVFKIYQGCHFEPYDTYFREELGRHGILYVPGPAASTRTIRHVITLDANSRVRESLLQKCGFDIIESAEKSAVARAIAERQQRTKQKEPNNAME